MKRSSARLSDIAKTTGFSVNTVSLALRGSTRISEETRSVIQQAAEQLHYIPNGIARSLVNKKSNTIGIILRDLSNPVFFEATKRIEEILAGYGYMLIIVSAKDDGVAEIHSLISQQVQGILVYPVWSRRAVQTFEQLRKEHFPLVLMSSNGRVHDFDTVYVDQQIGGYLATEYLARLGHKKIAIISNDGLKLNGYLQALRDYGCVIDNELMRSIPSQSYQCGYDVAQYLFSRHKGKFTSVFATTDRAAIGFMKYCRENSIKIPDEISLIGYDNNEFSAFLDIPLTTMSYHITEEAEQAVRILLQRINSDLIENSPIQIQIRPELIVRETCKRLLL